MNKTIRIFAVAASASLLVGALVGPADAGKKKKPKPVAACAPYASPDWATDAPATTIVTEAATAEAPVEVKITAHEGLGLSSTDGPSGDEGAPSHVFHNVQVDTAAPTG